MRILLSFLLVLGGAGLHLYLLSLGIQRPYPIESYAPMAAGVALAAASALRKGGWWRYGVVLLHLLFLMIFVRWTASRSARLIQSTESGTRFDTTRGGAHSRLPAGLHQGPRAGPRFGHQEGNEKMRRLG